MPPEHLLIVDQSLRETAQLAETIATVTARYGFDAFTLRQRLRGPGRALLAKGPREKLAGLANCLTASGIACRLLAATPPRPHPARVRGFALSADALSFLDQGKTLATLNRGEPAVAVLADLSGTAVEKGMQRLLAQNTYGGAAAVAPLAGDELYRTLLRQQPVLDLYLLGEDRSVRSALRVFGGRFDPAGLGGHATYSVSGNMDNLIGLVRDLAGEFTLATDFGLSQLPGGQMLSARDGPDWQRKNLARLARFGRLTVDIVLTPPLIAQGAAAAPTAALDPLPIAGAGALAPPAPQPPRDEGRANEQLSNGRRLPLPPPGDDGEGSLFSRERFALIFGGIGGSALLFGLETTRLAEGLLGFGLRTGSLPAALALACLLMGARQMQIRRRIENTPTSRVRSLAMGMVEVHGRALRRYALVSPMTQSACVYYRLRKYRRNDRGWHLKSTLTSGNVPFVLEDDTGRITIEPRGARVKPRTRNESFSEGGAAITRGGRGGPDEKWVEEVICEGSSLYVLGFARRPERGPGLRERTIAALRRLKRDRRALRRYDADGDGRISESEWETARGEAERRVLQESLLSEQEGARDLSPAVIGRPHPRSLPFIIAETESEARLTGRFAWSAPALLAVGLVLAAVAGWQAMRHFGGL